MAPKRAKKTRLTETLAPEKRGLEKKSILNMGWLLRASQATKATSTTAPPQQSAEARDGKQRPHRVGPAGLGVLGGGHQQGDGYQADAHDGGVDQEHRAPPEVSQQPATRDRPDGDAQA